MWGCITGGPLLLEFCLGHADVRLMEGQTSDLEWGEGLGLRALVGRSICSSSHCSLSGSPFLHIINAPSSDPHSSAQRHPSSSYDHRVCCVTKQLDEWDIVIARDLSLPSRKACICLCIEMSVMPRPCFLLPPANPNGHFFSAASTLNPARITPACSTPPPRTTRHVPKSKIMSGDVFPLPRGCVGAAAGGDRATRRGTSGVLSG